MIVNPAAREARLSGVSSPDWRQRHVSFDNVTHSQLPPQQVLFGVILPSLDNRVLCSVK
jgi:hypothetical protein